MSSSRRRIIFTSSGPAGRDAQCRRGTASRPAATVPVPVRSERSRQSNCMRRNASSAHSDRDLRFRLHQNGPTVPGPSRRIPSRRAERRGSAQVRSRRFLHIAGYPCDKPHGDMWEHTERLDRFTPHSLYYSVDTGRDRTEVRSGCGAIVPARSAAIGIHASGPPGYDEDECRPARRYRSRPPAQPIGACGSRAN